MRDHAKRFKVQVRQCLWTGGFFLTLDLYKGWAPTSDRLYEMYPWRYHARSHRLTSPFAASEVSGVVSNKLAQAPAAGLRKTLHLHTLLAHVGCPIRLRRWSHGHCHELLDRCSFAALAIALLGVSHSFCVARCAVPSCRRRPHRAIGMKHGSWSAEKLPRLWRTPSMRPSPGGSAAVSQSQV